MGKEFSKVNTSLTSNYQNIKSVNVFDKDFYLYDIDDNVSKTTTLDPLADEVLTGGYSTNGDLTQDVLTDGGVIRGNIGGESLIEESRSRGEILDDILAQEDIDSDNV